MKTELIYGIHAVENLLEKNTKTIQMIWLQKGRHDNRFQKLLMLAKAKVVKVQQVEKHEIEGLVGEVTHQGVIAEIRIAAEKTETDIPNLLQELSSPPLILIIDGVQDPHNLGACLRSAEAAGAHMVIIPKDRSASVTPVVRKVACGAAEAISVIRVTNLARTIRQLQEIGVWIVGAAGEAEQLFYEVNYQGSIAIIVGAEGEGMRELTKKHCDYLVKIPMQGIVSSLNVSVATGVLLFEAVRQRQLAKK
ncbi:MAG: 23S rRNA (guanosine(2251)-2'-O)-methyltransferase RlmB [Gammaproteobacteria bacterium RIFCSPHIGHO2_12_FULL_35_23]|nr:MAG: 23S rRNA (guanosine(2251)-2'-O)-methyltransferase RlmB [Gammaproteobacteria bacterium RIFCSPHIGHO2_12_FULL_35_23]